MPTKSVFFLLSNLGATVVAPTNDDMQRELAALHGAGSDAVAWLTDGIAFTIERHRDDRLVFGVPDRLLRHMTDVDDARCIEIWQMLIAGGREPLERLEWHDGAGTERAESGLAQIEREILEGDRQFHAELGLERSDQPCGWEGCVRGSVEQSRFCRRHHCETVHRRPCFGTD